MAPDKGLSLTVLNREGGGTSSTLSVAFNERGDLVMEGQDVGRAPEEVFGDDDYEYWVTVPADQKDRLLLHLVKALVDEGATPSSSFMAWLKEREIPYEFSSF
jgi:hypothetical protein